MGTVHLPGLGADGAYRDALIDNGSLPPDWADDGPPTAWGGGDGLPRGFELDLGWSRDSAVGNAWHSWRGRISGYLDSENWGRWQLDASRMDLQPASGGRRANRAVLLTQRDMPVANGWRAGHEVGHVLLPVLPGAAVQARWGLPSIGATGLVARWEDLENPRRWFLGAARDNGESGRYAASGDVGGDGQFALLLGSERGDSERMTGTMAFLSRQNGTGSRPWGLYHSQRQRLGERLVQGNLMLTRDQAGQAAAGWADGQTEIGAHHLGAGLRLATRPVHWLGTQVGLGRGVYARWRHQAGAASMAAEADLLSHAHRRRSAIWVSALRGGESATWSGQVSGAQDDQGWRAAASVARESAWSAKWQARWRPFVQWDAASTRRAIALSVGVDLSHEASSVTWSFGAAVPLTAPPGERTGRADVSISARLTSQWQASTYLHWRRDLDGPSGRSHIDAGLATDWQLGPGWMLSVQAMATRGASVTPDLPGPVVGAPVANTPPAGTTVALFLRYQWGAGQAAASRAGSGTVHGRVFFDANRNGQWDPDERGAAQVTLVIDRRHSVRTDESGFYSLSLQASAAAYSISVAPEGLPLPWSPLQEAIRVSVSPRGEHRVDVALVPS